MAVARQPAEASTPVLLITTEALNYLVEKSQNTVAYLKNQKRLPETTITNLLR